MRFGCYGPFSLISFQLKLLRVDSTIRSPAHNPGVDLLRSRVGRLALGDGMWVADVEPWEEKHLGHHLVFRLLLW